MRNRSSGQLFEVLCDVFCRCDSLYQTLCEGYVSFRPLIWRRFKTGNTYNAQSSNMYSRYPVVIKP